MTPQDFALLCMLDRGSSHSGRGGLSVHTFRALERRGLCLVSAVHTWETDWRLTEAGRVHARALEEGRRRGLAFRAAEQGQ